MARVRERKTRDFNQVKCIKNEREHLLVKEDEIRHRWQEYFDKLFNGENIDTTFQLDNSFDDTNRRFVRRIQESEVREALKRLWDQMKGGKAMGPDGIPIEVWRCLGDSYSMANSCSTIFFDRIRCLMSGEEVYWYQSTRIKEIFKVVLIIGELS